ncbi:hypothetical protein ASD74_04750 [Rhizobium sp. Root564]|nr:hypothetical protein ASD74_04750 [Rhizobium sp. Root564]
MTLPRPDWQTLGALRGAELKGQVFSILQRASLAIQEAELDEPALLEFVPRLADVINERPELETFKEPFSALARSTGLWNYIDRDYADTSDALLAESVTISELGNITLHREQIGVLNDILAGKNVILSAPTSFGKSLLIDALLATGRYRRVAIILPTIALLDEFRRRLRRRFEDTFSIIMHPGEVVSKDHAAIFLGTQERLISRADLGALDLTVVDEFYKLDPERQDDRSVTLNAAVYRLLSKSKQFFFLGPNIDNVRISNDSKWKFEFIRTRFSTVAVDTFDLTRIENKQDRLFEEIAEDRNWPALVFVSAPDKANRIAKDASKEIAVSDDSSDFADWLNDNVGSNWSLVKTVRFGFGVHHGRIPRAIASQMVRMFNEGSLPVLFCTSTLIEGVNTAAKTVLIYDKKINRTSFDFFTFSNIRGRAGRLGQHHVGQVFLFNAPPAREEMEVSPTLFGEDDEAPDSYVVYLDEQDTNEETELRVANLRDDLGLDSEGLRLAASVGLDVAHALRREVAAEFHRGSRRLAWSGYPDYKSILALVEIACTTKRPREFGAVSASQLTLFISRLRQNRELKGFLLWFNDNFRGEDTEFDNVFKFLRACEYGLPQVFALVELFAKAYWPQTDYNLFLRELSRWFRAEELKNLDEEGIPIQISERFYALGDDRASLLKKLKDAVKDLSDELSVFEHRWLTASLI